MKLFSRCADVPGPRMSRWLCRAYRFFPLLLVLWLVGPTLNVPVRAQEATPAAPIMERPFIDFNAPKLLEAGLGVLIFIIWLYDMRRQVSLEDLLKKYDAAEAAHLAVWKASAAENTEAFRQINARQIEVVNSLLTGQQQLTQTVLGLIKDMVSAVATATTLLQGVSAELSRERKP